MLCSWLNPLLLPRLPALEGQGHGSPGKYKSLVGICLVTDAEPELPTLAAPLL